MEFPFGHHRHQHRDEYEQEPPPQQPPYPYPPPSTYPPSQRAFHPFEDPSPPYPPPHGHVYPPPSDFPPNPNYNSYDGGIDSQNYPPPPHHNYSPFQSNPSPLNSPYPPPYTQQQHESHTSYQNHPQSSIESDDEDRHRFRPHMPSFVESRIHNHGHSSTHNNDLDSKPSVRVYCKADTNYSLAIRDRQVILTPSNPDDPFQHWVKDEKYSTKVKDHEGFPCFALVNKATGQAMQHSIGATQPVELSPYNPDKLDQSVLWTMSKDVGEGYRTIRMVNNIKLMLDAFNGDKKHGGVRDGTTVVVWEWKTGENQRWKIERYCKSFVITSLLNY